MSSIGCGWYYASKYRAKLRHQYSLPEEPCADGAIHFFCCPCALSQEHRELKHRGLDPSLGKQSLLPLSLFSNEGRFSYKCLFFVHCNYFTTNKGWQGNNETGRSNTKTPPFVASGMDR